jgi:hypothetical protein
MDVILVLYVNVPLRKWNRDAGVAQRSVNANRQLTTYLHPSVKTAGPGAKLKVESAVAKREKQSLRGRLLHDIGVVCGDFIKEFNNAFRIRAIGDAHIDFDSPMLIGESPVHYLL